MATKSRQHADAAAQIRSTLHVPVPPRERTGQVEHEGRKPQRTPPPRLARRVAAVVVVLALLPLIGLAAVDLRLTSALDRIDGALAGLGERPALATDGSVTMLMLATGAGRADNPSLQWRPDAPRVVSAVFVTISGDRRQIDLDWLPLRGPILAGLDAPAPSSAVSATELWTGRRVDHLAVVGWSTLARLGRDNDVSDELAPGAGRAQQQAYLREVLEDTLHAEMRKEPWMLYRALHTTAEGMAVEEEWSAWDMNRLVFSLRNMRSAQISFGALDEPVTP